MRESSNHLKPHKRSPLPFWCFSIVIVRLGHRFLLVHERKHGQTWYLPAGRLEPGESFEQAAIREVEEESGLKVTLDGIIQVQLSPPLQGKDYRQRVIFMASPIDDSLPRNYPNADTLGACWVTIEEAKRLPLRGKEVIEYFEYVRAGKAIYPLDIMGREK